MTQSKVAVFHPGTQHSWQTALALQQLDRLAFYATSIFYRADRWPYRLERLPGPLGRKLGQEFRRFAKPELDPDLVHTAGILEWLERIAARAGLLGLAGWLDRAGNRRFVDTLAPAIRSDKPFALWGYNSSSLTSFALAREFGRSCILDRTIGDFRAYNRDMAMLQDRYADWFTARERVMPALTIACEAREHALANRIVVGCDFAARTVREFAETPEIAGKVEVLEYCYDEQLFSQLPPPGIVGGKRPVRFLFLGLAIPRKGFHHVLEAIAALPESDAKLTVVGRLGVPERVLSRYADRIDYLPTVARGEVPGIMAAHDVLLFPSYFEGAGIVLYEALAAGLALIQSDRAAVAVTPDTGILLETLSTEALLEAMCLAISDRARLAFWRSNAQAAAARHNFAGYRSRVAALLDSMDC